LAFWLQEREANCLVRSLLLHVDALEEKVDPVVTQHLLIEDVLQQKMEGEKCPEGVQETASTQALPLGQ